MSTLTKEVKNFSGCRGDEVSVEELDSDLLTELFAKGSISFMQIAHNLSVHLLSKYTIREKV